MCIFYESPKKNLPYVLQPEFVSCGYHGYKGDQKNDLVFFLNFEQTLAYDPSGINAGVCYARNANEGTSLTDILTNQATNELNHLELDNIQIIHQSYRVNCAQCRSKI